jgi:hypothetical protein
MIEVLVAMLGVIVGWGLSFCTELLREKKRTRREFETLIWTVRLSKNPLSLDRWIVEVRKFFLGNPKLLEKHEVNRRFFEDWLVNLRDDGIPMRRNWDDAVKTRLLAEVKELKA